MSARSPTTTADDKTRKAVDDLLAELRAEDAKAQTREPAFTENPTFRRAVARRKARLGRLYRPAW